MENHQSSPYLALVKPHPAANDWCSLYSTEATGPPLRRLIQGQDGTPGPTDPIGQLILCRRQASRSVESGHAQTDHASGKKQHNPNLPTVAEASEDVLSDEIMVQQPEVPAGSWEATWPN
ncbi:MAG: hypothetical protein LBV30_10565 [Propionibacteriaceae bacterium]|jgi:hypothetical protein|nr:hypothetical protein [Propionibacteriaceae bacterium]